MGAQLCHHRAIPAPLLQFESCNKCVLKELVKTQKYAGLDISMRLLTQANVWSVGRAQITVHSPI